MFYIALQQPTVHPPSLPQAESGSPHACVYICSASMIEQQPSWANHQPAQAIRHWREGESCFCTLDLNLDKGCAHVRAGLLQPLQAELAETRDALSAAAALELVAELAAGGAGAAATLGSLLAPQLAGLLRAPDTFLQCQALRVRHTMAAFLT